ncbi:MAG: HAMP domain-containing sensor histidine kinase, partial [Thermodesulfobacteriota bacterium]
RFYESQEEPFPLHSSLPGPFIRMAIQDTGPGIPADNLNKIFDPYFTTKHNGEGTGLGLYIVSGILKNYGASYHMDSTVGQGTTFTIDFPLSDSGKI